MMILVSSFAHSLWQHPPFGKLYRHLNTTLQAQQRLYPFILIDKIPSLVNEIRDEIAASCPKVITDGSRPFYVKWVDFDRDHVKVLVDCRLTNPPSGEKYYEARQGILEAIARAVRRKKVDFAMPTEVVFRK